MDGEDTVPVAVQNAWKAIDDDLRGFIEGLIGIRELTEHELTTWAARLIQMAAARTRSGQVEVPRR